MPVNSHRWFGVVLDGSLKKQLTSQQIQKIQYYAHPKGSLLDECAKANLITLWDQVSHDDIDQLKWTQDEIHCFSNQQLRTGDSIEILPS